ncbi:MAG: hypothetical protein KF770_15475 [Anaerolineae bacterium]|nr:hypothetical protein [Anaerolineae bacterium]
MTSKANQHIALYGRLYITIITYYEVWRGVQYKALKYPHFKRQSQEREQQFQTFCYENEVLLLDQLACRHAADIYATLRLGGEHYQENADILIAGIALPNNCSIATENITHFAAMNGVQVQTW